MWATLAWTAGAGKPWRSSCIASGQRGKARVATATHIRGGGVGVGPAHRHCDRHVLPAIRHCARRVDLRRP
eukprot:4603140-Prymnesium_polylepis.1